MSSRSGTPRRSFLRTLALAPAAAAAAAGCATTSAAAPSAAPAGAGQAPAGGGDALEPLRAFPLELEAEPALIFRALPVRPD
ncbi:MAG: hypothetical protein QM767_06055 [Anaeromyxobacter sp.]